MYRLRYNIKFPDLPTGKYTVDHVNSLTIGWPNCRLTKKLHSGKTNPICVYKKQQMPKEGPLADNVRTFMEEYE